MVDAEADAEEGTVIVGLEVGEVGLKLIFLWTLVN